MTNMWVVLSWSARMWISTFSKIHSIDLYQEIASTAPRKQFGGSKRPALPFLRRSLATLPNHPHYKPNIEPPSLSNVLGLTLCICKLVPLPWQKYDNHVDSNISQTTQYIESPRRFHRILKKKTWPRNYQSTTSQPLAQWPMCTELVKLSYFSLPVMCSIPSNSTGMKHKLS